MPAGEIPHPQKNVFFGNGSIFQTENSFQIIYGILIDRIANKRYYELAVKPHLA